MTKTMREKLFKAAMKEGYDKFREGIISHRDWNQWSWTCYKFQDEEITHDELEEKLNGI